MKIAVLGPEGTFSESSLKGTFSQLAFELTFVADLDNLFSAVDQGQVDFAWLPWWNSGCGFLTDDHQIEFLSLFVNAKQPYTLYGEAFMPLDFALVANQGASITDIKTIHVNPYATSICKTFFNQHSDLQVVVEHSSSNAAKKVAATHDKSIAAAASPATAKEYGLIVLQDNMATPEEKATMQFILFGKSGAKINHAKTAQQMITSVIIQSTSPEALLKECKLHALSTRQSTQLTSTYLIDLTGAYDIESLEKSFGKALVSFLGSYPSHR